MDLHGQNLIGSRRSGEGRARLRAQDPTGAAVLEPEFSEATTAEVEAALELAETAFQQYRRSRPDERSAFLRAIAERIDALGDALLDRASQESGLGRQRLSGERARTTGQLRMFAELVEEGSWVDARIDRAIPDRTPLPKPDIRRMLIPMGPVAVFGASNFPLAFSVAGGDTASALAAGCSVVVKAHPAHPGTSEMVGRAILEAAGESGMPEGVFSLVHGASHEVGLGLVRHPLTAAVAFTGSLRGGRALFDAAATRDKPIPVFAEMGSINPVFLLPEATRERQRELAKGLYQSVTLGVGQFCTNPGLVICRQGEASDRLLDELAGLVAEHPAAPMLYEGICRSFQEGVERLTQIANVRLVATGPKPEDALTPAAAPALFQTDAPTYLGSRALQEELFGPATVVVTVSSDEGLLELARSLEGQLTASIHGAAGELADHGELVRELERKVGRLLINGFPTGVEVCPSMHHGGPYPATTDVRTTSVGTAAIHRFVRPICYQDFPQELLPAELRDRNERGIWRLVDGELGRE